jgi:hypothetical protein
MNACTKVSEISKEIRHWMTEQHEVKEESLTDWLLYQMMQIKNCTFYQFSRHQEAKIGADWEWFFRIRENVNYKMRVQAKKIFPDNYPHIAYSNKYGLQIETLLENALRTTSIPLYAFYTSQPEYDDETTLIKKDEGVYITGANKLYTKFILHGRKKIEPIEIIEISKTLSCFFCSLLCGKKYDFDVFFQDHYELENAKDIAKSLRKETSDNTILGRCDKLPHYISYLLEHKNADISSFEEIFNDEIDGLNAILIFDFREEND